MSATRCAIWACISLVITFSLTSFSYALAHDDAPQFSISVKVEGHFAHVVEAHGEAEHAIAATIKVLEHTFGPVADRGREIRTPSLTIHPNADAYKAAVRRIGAKRFEENLAVTDYDRHESHVAIQPTSATAVLDTIGLPLLTRRQIAHEAAHLWCDARWPRAYRNAQPWLREGVATWASEAAMRTLGLINRAEDDPFLSTRIVLAQHVVGSLPTTAAPSATTNPFGRFDRRTQYALDWLWVRMLIESAASSARMGNAAEMHNIPADQFAAWFTHRPDASIPAFTTYVRSLRPQWAQDARSLEIHGTEMFQLSFPSETALGWKLRGPTSTPYRIRGVFRVLGKTDAQVSVYFARDALGYLAVTFRHSGDVAISRFRRKTGQWKQLAASASVRPKSSAPCRFEIIVSGETVTLNIDGRPACKTKVRDKRMTGPWGLSVEANHAVRWQNLHVLSGKDDPQRSRSANVQP